MAQLEEWLNVPERFRINDMPFCGNLQEYYLKKFRAVYRRRARVIDSLASAEDALKYIKNVRAKIRRQLFFPPERTPLNAQSTGKHSKDGYTLENVVFFSRPGVAVSSLFFCPDTPGVHPAVLFLCGHTQTGKIGYYQPIASDLARQGFAVLLVDPMGQGERNESGKYCTEEHNLLGRRLGLAGEQFGAWRVYDGIRAIDYLLSRPEVDSSILGVTGCSGGGTLTTLLAAVDDRITMTATSCAVTTYLANLENEEACDIEQQPQTLGAAGIEMADLLIAAAPRPALILGQENDFFDLRGGRAAAGELKKIYTLLGRGCDTELYADKLWHGFSINQRFEMMKFFGRYAGLEPVPLNSVDTVELPENELLCCKKGKITNYPGAVTQKELIARCCRDAAAQRQHYTAAELRKKLRSFLAVGRITLPHYRVLRPSWVEFDSLHSLGRFGIESEPGQVMAVLKQFTADSDKPCYRLAENCAVKLYIPHLDGQLEFERKKFAFPGQLCILDLRGTGELTPACCQPHSTFVAGCLPGKERDFFNYYQCDYQYAQLGDFIGKPMLGQRVRDILSTVELLKSRNCSVTLYGCGQGAVAALFAAFLADLPVTLENMPESYLALAEAGADTLPQAMLPFGILKVCDLDELVSYTNATII